MSGPGVGWRADLKRLRMLWAFFLCWRNNPQQRFGQLVSNTSFQSDPFYERDANFLAEWRSK